MSLYNLSEIEAELAKVEARRSVLLRMRDLAREYEQAFGAAEAKAASPTRKLVFPQRRLVAAAVQAKPRESVMEMTETVALNLIEQKGFPVSTREVIEEFRRREIPLPDKAALNVLSARLSNSSKLQGRRGVGWWPQGRPWPDEELLQQMEADDE